MRNPARTPFAAIFQNEVLLNSKRVAPYALMAFCSARQCLAVVGLGTSHRIGLGHKQRLLHRRRPPGLLFLIGTSSLHRLYHGGPGDQGFPRWASTRSFFQSLSARAAVSSGKILRQLLCAGVLSVCFPADAVGAAGISHVTA